MTDRRNRSLKWWAWHLDIMTDKAAVEVERRLMSEEMDEPYYPTTTTVKA